MSHHRERFISFLKKEISSFVERSFPCPENTLLSVTKVIVRPSLEEARVFISVYPESCVEDIFSQLKKIESEIRAHLADKARRRNIPRIVFVRDETQQSEIRLENLLENVQDT